LRNVIRIITETGLRVYKELMPMKKEQVDLENALAWIPDSKTPNGVAEVPLTNLALDAFHDQIRISGTGPWLFPNEESSTGYQKKSENSMASDVAKSKRALFPYLRFAIHVRNPTKFRRCGGRVGDATAAAGRCEGVQEILTDEASDEEGGVEENQSQSK
jgi:integrase